MVLPCVVLGIYSIQRAPHGQRWEGWAGSLQLVLSRCRERERRRGACRLAAAALVSIINVSQRVIIKHHSQSLLTLASVHCVAFILNVKDQTVSWLFNVLVFCWLVQRWAQTWFSIIQHCGVCWVISSFLSCLALCNMIWNLDNNINIQYTKGVLTKR